MTTMEINNEMIYELLKDFKADVYKRLEQTEARIEMIHELLKEFKTDIYQRFEQIDHRLERIENQQTEDRKILMNLWENRENMKLSLTRSLLTVTGIISGAVAIIVSFITGKAIIFSMKN